MRQHRTTSKAAHESVKEHKSAMYKKIVEGMERLRIGGTFEEIAKVSGLQPAQVWKRLPEMIELGMVFNVGITRKTSSGRSAMVRQLVGMKAVDPSMNKTQAQLKAHKTLSQLNLYAN